MASEHVLELDIISNDLSGAGFASARANASSYFASVETEARRAASSLDALERRAALAGTGGLERINLQRSFSLSDLRLEHEQVTNLTEAWDRLSTAKKHSVDIATLADITPRAPEGDISREEVLRRNLLAYDQFRQAQRQSSIEHNQRDVESLQRSTAQLGATPTQRVALDRNQFFQTFSGTGAQRADAEAAFATRAKIALDQETEASGRAAGRATLRGEAEFAAALKAQQGVDTYTRSVERENEVYGKSGIEKIRLERERLFEQYKGHPAAIEAITTRYAQMEEAEKRATDTAHIERLKNGFLGVAAAIGGAASVMKGFIVDTALYAARNETLVVVTRQLALANQLSPPAVERQVLAVQRGGITTQESRDSINKMIIAGLDVAKAPELAELARNAGTIGNINSSDALDAIIRGIVQRRVQELRTVGIQVSFQDAFQRAAASAGKSTADLTDNEKRLAAFNEVLAQAPRLAGAYDAAMTTAGKQVTSLRRFVDEARASIGDGLIPALSETVTLLTRGFTHVQQHGEAYGDLAKVVGTAVTAFAVFKTAAFGAAILGLGSFALPIAGVAAGLTALAGIVLFGTDKFTAQRDAIRLHIDQLNAQREGLHASAQTYEDYTKALVANNRAIIISLIALAKAEADEARAGRRQVVAGSPYAVGGATYRETPQTFVGPDGKTYTVGQYESRFDHRAGDATVNKKLNEADEDKDTTEAKAARADRDKVAQAIIAARKQGGQLDVQLAEIQLQEKQRTLAASIDKRKGLIPESDYLQELQLAQAKVDLETKTDLANRGYRYDSKTQTFRDLQGVPQSKEFARLEEENRAKRLRNEFETLASKDNVRTEQYLKAQNDQTFGAAEKQRESTAKAEQTLVTENERLSREHVEKRFAIAEEANTREKDLALAQLQFVDAQTIQQKIQLEDQKLAIEKTYAERALAIQIARINASRDYDIGQFTAQLNRDHISLTSPEAIAGIEVRNEKYDQEIDQARAATVGKEVAAAQDIANQKTKLGIQQNERIFDSLKRSAEGVFDALLTKSKSFSDVMKDLFKTAILTPIKDILSSQTAALFTELLTGQKVTFAPLGNGQGPLGGLGNVLGRLGLGQRIIGNQAPHSINLPNHLGDVSLISGAVPVFAVNLAAGTSIGSRSITPSILQTHALSTPFRGIPSLVEGGLDLSNLLPQTPYAKGGIPSLAEGGLDIEDLLPQTTPYIDSTIKFPNIGETGFRSGPRSPQDPSIFSPHGFLALGEQLASASSDLSGIFAGASNAYSDQYSSSSTSGAAKVINDLVAAIPEAPAYTSRGDAGGFLGTILGAGGVSNAYEKQTSDQIGALLRGDTSGVSDDDRRILRQVLESRPSWERPSPEILDKIYPSGSGGGDGQSGGTGGVGGILGQIFGGKGKSGGIGGILSNLKGNFYSPNDIILGPGRATTVGGIVQSLGGGILGKAVGGLAGFANSPGAAALGLYAAYDGIRRGGIAGTLEAAAGGAEIGFKVGGPIGALAGAAIGGAIATTKSLFFESDRDHTKKLVKQIYGFSINDSTADAIIQIAKQKYGGAISIAVRTQEVRDLLKLYAETLGNKGAKDQFVADTVHSASLVESRGGLYQNAIYDNGEAYSYAGPLGVLGGISSTKLPTAARDSGGFYGNLSINLNGQSALGALAGQVVRVSTPSFIQSQSVSGSRASIGRNSQAALNFAPSAISR